MGKDTLDSFRCSAKSRTQDGLRTSECCSPQIVILPSPAPPRGAGTWSSLWWEGGCARGSHFSNQRVEKFTDSTQNVVQVCESSDLTVWLEVFAIEVKLLRRHLVSHVREPGFYHSWRGFRLDSWLLISGGGDLESELVVNTTFFF